MLKSTENHTDSHRSARVAEIDDLLAELTAIRAGMVGDRTMQQHRLDAVHANFAESARNLLHYLELRCHDLRPLQLRLAALGLSSLGRSESHVLATVDAVVEVLGELSGRPWSAPSPEGHLDFATGQRLLEEHTQVLLGPTIASRDVRIMVTMPTEAADDFTLISNLVQQGMDCMRINCAHDDAATWQRMIENLRRAETSHGRTCRVVMDLGGPKLRTGPMEPGPMVVRIRPRRDIRGRVTAPSRIWCASETAPQSPPSPADGTLRVPEEWLVRLHAGERVELVDARGAKRAFTIVDVTDRGCWAEANKTLYVVPGVVLRANDGTAGLVGPLPSADNAIFVRQQDQLILTRDLKPGRPASYDTSGRVLTPATIGCTIPEVFEDVRHGESIWFDDGKVGAVIEKVEQRRVLVRITHARARGEWLRADKGINLPESRLQLGALTATDLEQLPFVAQHADIVELSFANSARDVEMLQQHLMRLGKGQPAIVLKIETRRGFENLPDMLLTAMRGSCCGVMIARGDLAVECGFERLAEVQEEILWICEAAHVPVIWATQVLETLARDGMPSRAEITDAAMGHRAECVMLNKGPHIVSAVRVLDDILKRMQSHQTKKRSMLRELRLAHGLLAGPPRPREVPPAPNRVD